MKIDDFIANKVSELMAFQEAWLESYKKQPDRFPLEFEDEMTWDAQYEYHQSRSFLGALLEDAEKRAKAKKQADEDAAKEAAKNASPAAA